jgi:hypothetical protein
MMWPFGGALYRHSGLCPTKPSVGVLFIDCVNDKTAAHGLALARDIAYDPRQRRYVQKRHEG